jgi:exodeoxyribonuclease VII large subunit
MRSQLQRRLERAQGERQQRLDWLASRLLHPAERLTQRRQQVESLTRRLGLAGTRRTDHSRLLLLTASRRLEGARPRPAGLAERLTQHAQQLARQMDWQLSREQMKLNTLANGLKQLDPHAVLNRGYALVTGADGRAVRNAAALTPGNTLKLDFARGSAQATVDQVVAASEAD